PLEPLERDDDAPADRHAPARVARSPAARHDRDAAVVAPLDRGGDPLGARRPADRVRPAAYAARLGLVAQIRGGVARKDRLVVEEPAELGFDRRQRREYRR